MKNLRILFCAAAGAVALVSTSCTYDPYYSSSSVGTSYSSGFGQGYGYGGSSFNSSLFISTGNPRWGYDPSCYSYYDYSSRRYYDPYLNGYYPIGYRPRVVYGTPHPHGWRPGRGYISPPRRVTNVTVVNYRDREARYRDLDYSWARRVRNNAQQRYRSDNLQQDRPNFNGSRPSWRDNQQNDPRRNRLDDLRSRNERPPRFNRPVNTYDPSQRDLENWNNRINRQERPQLGNPGGERNFNRQQESQRFGRQQNFGRIERQRFNQEERRTPQAQQEIRPRMRQPQVEESQIQQSRIQESQAQRPQMQRRSEPNREARSDARGQRRERRSRDGGEL